MSEELKPCPLCGGKVAWVSGAICCRRCGLELHHLTHSYELNIKTWNTRTPEQAIAATLGGGECENLIDPWSVHESFENDFECSACHASGHANGNIDHGEFLYCPRCGAKVRKEVRK